MPGREKLSLTSLLHRLLMTRRYFLAQIALARMALAFSSVEKQ